MEWHGTRSRFVLVIIWHVVVSNMVSAHNQVGIAEENVLSALEESHPELMNVDTTVGEDMIYQTTLSGASRSGKTSLNRLTKGSGAQADQVVSQELTASMGTLNKSLKKEDVAAPEQQNSRGPTKKTEAGLAAANLVNLEAVSTAGEEAKEAKEAKKIDVSSKIPLPNLYANILIFAFLVTATIGFEVFLRIRRTNLFVIPPPPPLVSCPLPPLTRSLPLRSAGMQAFHRPCPQGDFDGAHRLRHLPRAHRARLPRRHLLYHHPMRGGRAFQTHFRSEQRRLCRVRRGHLTLALEVPPIYPMTHGASSLCVASLCTHQMLEEIHMVIFVIMLVVILQTIGMIYKNSNRTGAWSRAEERILTPKAFSAATCYHIWTYIPSMILTPKARPNVNVHI